MRRALIDLTPILEEGMAVNHPHHPRGPVLLPNQKYDFVRYFYADTWRRTGGPPVFDGMPADWAEPETARGWRNEEVLIHTHLGAHVDAAQHFDPNSSQDAAGIPLDRCFGSAVLLDFRHLGKEPFAITTSDLDEAERQAKVEVGKGDIVILHTGWLARWGVGPNADREKYGGIPNPGLHRDTPPWFIEREVALVGGDIPNIDYDMTSSCHVNFLCRRAAGKEPILIIENLANLERIPVSRFLFVGLPLPIRGGTGSPIRAVAVVEQAEADDTEMA
jgi:kynurenine formamidase